ncbi:MAG: hypothetical protein JSU63_14825 [Phycisphaerales bacterium]|nr:MAG: hypothetical protein JSU63_14825 [Phycisphaerales bacterium]
MNALLLPQQADGLLPHRAPMLLLDEVVDYREGTVRANVMIGPDHLFADGDGELDPVALVEILAQAAAVLRGCRAKVEEDDEQRIGFLAGLKRMKISSTARVGDHLSAEVRQSAAIGQAVVMEGRLSRGGDCLAEGTLNVWEELTGGMANGARRAALLGGPSGPTFIQPRALEGASPIYRAVSAGARQGGLSVEQNEVIGEFCFDESFAGFQGHFPGFPILPGIVMLEIVLLLSEHLTCHPMKLAEVERAKFAGQVRPGESIHARVHLTPFEKDWRIGASIINPASDTLILKLNATARQVDSLRADEDSIRS